jgi:Family of unknown function (DUF6600)/FecR protein
MKKLLASLAVVFLMLGVLPATSSAQANSPQGSPNQPVNLQPGVARVSFIHGDVSSQRGDNGDWVAVTLNTPVVEGDRVATGQKSRAELQLDWADILRMSDNATAKVASLSRTNIQVQVGQGLVTYSVLKGSEANSEIDTPNAAVRPDGPGEYRILVNSDAETQVIVRQGSAEVSTPQGSTHADKGQMITVAGTDHPEYQTAAAPGRDDWDAWNNERNRRINSAESWRKTDRYYTGSEDLDAYGRWSDVPGYGPVWIPAEGPGWAPYRDGRWVYEPYYGWTWVSYEPWGWAPYHYGRWFVYDDDWVWWPGPVSYDPFYYPVWAPAYVSFFGFGGGGWGASFGFGFGGFNRIGWFPVGPCDPFFPWFGRFGNRVNIVNITNITNIRNTTIVNNFNSVTPLAGERGFGNRRFSNFDEAFRNQRVRSGMSSMAGNQFGRAAVPIHQQPVNEASLRQASLMTGKMPVSPSRGSFSPSGRAANASAFRGVPPNSQRFFTSASRPNTGINRNAGSFARASTRAGSQAPFRAVNSTQSGARAPNGTSRPGWHTFAPTQSGHANRSAQAFQSNHGARSVPAPAQSNRPGWHTFAPTQSGRVNRSAQAFQSNHGARSVPAPAQSNRPGWHTFTPPQSGRVNRPSQSFGANRAAPNSWGRASTGNRSNPSSFGANSAPGKRGSWQHFTPPARQSQPQRSSRGFAQPGASPRGNYSSPNSHYRPPLNMRQPIVRPRGGSYGYGAPQRSYGQPRGGGYNGPRGGGYSAPRGGYSAPRGGGGGYRGGGGGRSGGGRSR